MLWRRFTAPTCPRTRFASTPFLTHKARDASGSHTETPARLNHHENPSKTATTAQYKPPASGNAGPRPTRRCGATQRHRTLHAEGNEAPRNHSEHSLLQPVLVLLQLNSRRRSRGSRRAHSQGRAEAWQQQMTRHKAQRHHTRRPPLNPCLKKINGDACGGGDPPQRCNRGSTGRHNATAFQAQNSAVQQRDRVRVVQQENSLGWYPVSTQHRKAQHSTAHYHIVVVYLGSLSTRQR